MRVETDYDRMGRFWLGLGNLKAKCWFIGMEPGGDSALDIAWSKEWATKFGAAPTVDFHECATSKEKPFLGPNNRLHPTWSPLIRCRLSYAAQPTDDEAVLAYQRETFAKSRSGEALLEVSAYSAKGLSEPSLGKKYLNVRVKHLGRNITTCHPETVVFYGRTYAGYYEEIAGGAFDADGLRWCDNTLCALTPHPFQKFGKSPPADFWVDLGQKMRLKVNGRKD